jgi:tetratricopeptide (TPR) repeat protein
MVRRVLRAEWLFRRGQRLAAQGRFDAACEAFTQALTLRPGAAGIYLHQALALSETARLHEAVAALKQAMALQPGNPVLPVFLARIYFDHTDYPQASTWCARALSLNPYNCHALALQALIELASGQVQQGYQRLQQPLPLPISVLACGLLWLGRKGFALRRHSRASRVPSVLQQANAALQGRILLQAETFLLQHPAQAWTLAQQLLEMAAAPNGETWADRLMTLLERCLTTTILGIRRLYDALRYAFQPARRAIHLQCLQAEHAAYRGQAATAQTLYAEVARQDPRMPDIQARLCEVCYAQGKFREALQHLRRFLKQLPDPDQPGADLSILHGELLCQVAQYQEAATVLAPVVMGTVRDYRLLYYRGLCQLHAGPPDTARRLFTQAVQQLNPDIAALRLAEMYRVHQLSTPGGSSGRL